MVVTWVFTWPPIIATWNVGFATGSKYSRLSLSRLPLSRTTAYLEEKIWSLFKHRNLTSGNKILWIRGEIAPQEQFLPFPTIFSIYSRLSLSRNRRDHHKHFEISVLRHIRFVILRKKQFEQPDFTNDYVISLL